LAAAAMMAMLVGCNNAKGPSEATGTNKATGSQSAAPASANEADVAKEKLKAALDAWNFGDSLEKFNASHADIEVADMEQVGEPVLLRYEIGASRFDGTHNFVVTLVFQSKGGTEIKKSVVYNVFPPNPKKKKWFIMSLEK